MQIVLFVLLAAFARILSIAQWVVYPSLLMAGLSHLYPGVYQVILTGGEQGRSEATLGMIWTLAIGLLWLGFPPCKRASARLNKVAHSLFEQ